MLPRNQSFYSATVSPNACGVLQGLTDTPVQSLCQQSVNEPLSYFLSTET